MVFKGYILYVDKESENIYAKIGIPCIIPATSIGLPLPEVERGG
jgi:hypothetical protein